MGGPACCTVSLLLWFTLLSLLLKMFQFTVIQTFKPVFTKIMSKMQEFFFLKKGIMIQAPSDAKPNGSQTLCAHFRHSPGERWRSVF